MTSKGKPFGCTKCGRQFHCKSNFNRHMTIHTGVKPYHCEICGRGFSQISNCQRHQRLHMRDTTDPGQTETKKRKVTQPVSHFESNPIMCEHDKCLNKKDEEKLDSENLAQKNKLNVENPSQIGKTGTDGQTMRQFKVQQLLTEKLDQHPPPFFHLLSNSLYSCGRCNRQFRCKSNLYRHWKIHTGEKPYLCGLCPKRFSQISNCQRHRRCHSKEGIDRKWQKNSEKLEKQSGQKESVQKRHNVSEQLSNKEIKTSKEINGQQEKENGKCFNQQLGPACGSNTKIQREIANGATQVQMLKRQDIFSENPQNRDNLPESWHPSLRLCFSVCPDNLYSCGQCGRKFCNKSNLGRHWKVHTGERPYICTVCERSFSQMSNLQRHLHCHSKTSWGKNRGKRLGPILQMTRQMQNYYDDEQTTAETHEGFVCASYESETCRKNFIDAESLQVHERINKADTNECHSDFVGDKEEWARKAAEVNDLGITIMGDLNQSESDFCLFTKKKLKSISDEMEQEALYFSQKPKGNEAESKLEYGKRITSTREPPEHNTTDTVIPEKNILGKHVKTNHSVTMWNRNVTDQEPCLVAACPESNSQEGVETIKLKMEQYFQSFHSLKNSCTKMPPSLHEGAVMETHESPETFTCLQCEKTFSTLPELCIHSEIHQNELFQEERELLAPQTEDVKGMCSRSQISVEQRKFFICCLCGKSFSSSSNLNKHQVIHTGARPYQCTYCAKSFNQSGNFKRHLRSAHPAQYAGDSRSPILSASVN
ncbi:zinc finger protein 189-like [Erpetoichthys calabaricus]|uniref:zinc finger protein 189-like n=1 Tax=Erpetoichthys calabaricus TaxID=27687 RepID=UPI00109F9F43|nr:zinc finger protein 189-like [Erpetoichthys calabaricus]